MKRIQPSLGIYGPHGQDRSGVARYIDASMGRLQNEYRVTVVSNATGWIDPGSFDVTLYHLGNNRMHHSAFKAASLKPGVAILHEYLHLNYYYETCELLDADLKAEIVAELTEATGVPASTPREFVDRCEKFQLIDPYAIDIGIEKYAVRNSTVTAVHSQCVADILQARYPGAAIVVIPFPVERWPTQYDHRYAASCGVPEGAFTFGSFGFIGEYKRVSWILAAWRRWHDRPRDSRLLLVGERQIEIDAEAEDVLELGYLGDTEFTKLLASVDCGIQLREPSLGETSGPAATLVAHRRPVILSEVPEMRLLGGSPRTIYVKSDGDVVGNLVGAMRAQYALGREPYGEFDPRFSWDGWSDIVLKLLDEHR